MLINRFYYYLDTDAHVNRHHQIRINDTLKKLVSCKIYEINTMYFDKTFSFNGRRTGKNHKTTIIFELLAPAILLLACLLKCIGL